MHEGIQIKLALDQTESRAKMKLRTLLTPLLLVVLISAKGVYITTCTAASPYEFSNAHSAISSAFVALKSAEGRGGNVSFLTDQLNTALVLLQRAQIENSTNPEQATVDLQNATQIASVVLLKAPNVGTAGASSRIMIEYQSLGEVIA